MRGLKRALQPFLNSGQPGMPQMSVTCRTIVQLGVARTAGLSLSHSNRRPAAQEPPLDLLPARLERHRIFVLVVPALFLRFGSRLCGGGCSGRGGGSCCEHRLLRRAAILGLALATAPAATAAALHWQPRAAASLQGRLQQQQE